jgi:hypothetical protein
MDRRNFFRKGLLAAGSMAFVAPTVLAGARNEYSISEKSFSLSIVTDDASLTIRQMESFLKLHRIDSGSIRYEAHPLTGRQIGDIAFVENGALVDFYTEDSDVGLELRSIAAEQAFPRAVDNPTLLTYRVGKPSSTARTAEIYGDNTHLLSLPVASDLRSHRIDGPHGHITVSVHDRGIQVVDASCRHRTCMEMGHIRNAGSSLACIPGRFTVQLSGSSSVDGISS